MELQRTRPVVLLADDSPTQAQRATRILEQAGYRVQLATNGREALAQARRWRPDVIVSDVLMPVLDGFGFCREVRRDPTLATVPVVLHTVTFVDRNDEEFARAIGATRYLLKPSDPEELVAQVRDVLATGHTGSAPVLAVDTEAFLAGYGERLVARLEQQVAELEEANRRLCAQNAEIMAARDQLSALLVEQQRGEAALQQAKDELELRVAERTSELRTANERLQHELGERKRAEVALQQAKDEAERASRAKSEFLSRMSHELRTPLNAILGFAQVLEMGRLSPSQREEVEQIRGGGQHLLGLINEVLDLARIESGRLALAPEPVAIGEVLREAVDLVRPLAARHAVRIDADGSALRGRHVLADRQRLKQVLLNLLSNAIKYNREGGHVTIGWEDAAGGLLRLAVADTGPGIPAEEIPLLFEPFERLGAERREVEGTGLGLALSKRLMEAMGGTLEVDSTIGQGSRFWLELPLAERVERTGERAPTAEAGAVTHTLLYVEDNLSNLTLVERILARRPGAKLIPAAQGSLGLELAREHHPDLILLDLHLPDIEGEAVLRELQMEARTRGIPVVVLSADASPRRIERLLRSGARAYLTKPLDVRQFLSIVDETLLQRER